MGYDFLFRDNQLNTSIKYIGRHREDITTIKSLVNKGFKFNIFAQARSIERLHSYWTLKRLSSYVVAIFENKDDEIEDLDSITIAQEVKDEFSIHYNR